MKLGSLNGLSRGHWFCNLNPNCSHRKYTAGNVIIIFLLLKKYKCPICDKTFMKIHFEKNHLFLIQLCLYKLVQHRLLKKKHLFANLTSHGLHWPFTAFAGLYCPKLASIEFSEPFLAFLAKKYIKVNPIHYSNIKNNFQMKI